RYAFKAGMTVEDVHRRTAIDPWFLNQIRDLVRMEDRLKACPSLEVADFDLLLAAKQHGFVDRQLANIWNTSEQAVREKRKALGIEAVFKLVDTCAAEFEAYTPYYYSTYEAPVRSVKDEGGRMKDEGEDESSFILHPSPFILCRGRNPPLPRQAADRDPRRRAQPDRARNRVRLLLRPGGAGPAAERLRDRHGQLEPGDRVHRLRHVRPPVLRAVASRGRPQHPRPRPAHRGHRPVRRADAAQPGQRPFRARRADHRLVGGQSGDRGGPREVRQAAGPAPAQAARQRDDAGHSGGPAHRPQADLSRLGAAELRPRRAGDGDRLRRGRIRPVRPVRPGG